MPKISGLQKKGHSYFLRIRVPKDVQPFFKTKEIIKTLETRDYSIAAQRIHTTRAAIEAEFTKARKQAKVTAEDKDMLSGYTHSELTALAVKWLNNLKHTQEKQRIKLTDQLSEEQIREYHLGLKQDEWHARQEVVGVSQDEVHEGMTTAVRFLKAEGIGYKRNSDNFRTLGHFFSKAILEFAQKNLREFEGRLHIGETQFAPSHLPKRVRKMGVLCEEYLNDAGRKLSASTQKNYTIIQRAISEVIGNDTPAHEVTREQCKEIRDLLIRFPSNATKVTKSKTMQGAIEEAKKKGLPVLADTTVNMALQKLHAIMEYAFDEDYIFKNPAHGLYVKEGLKSKFRRRPFDTDQLQKIFNASLYTGCVDDERGYNKPGSKKPRRARFWVPLISLWTGMRLNEICQLQVNDIIVQDGVNIILIQTESSDEDDEEEKRVKTESGIRFVPVHPMLERIGFLTFVEAQKKAGRKRLFPELEKGPRGDYGHAMSKWFNQFLENVSAKKKRTAFHSFRHSYRDALREAEIPLDGALQLGGWSRGTTDNDYGFGLKPKKLYEYICKISYPELDLSHLY